MPEYYEFICPVKICAGRKAISNLPYELEQLDVRKPLIITDKGVVGANLLVKIEASFADSNTDICAIFDETPPDSSNRVINNVAKIYKEKGCDSIVAVGGGSVLDTAKGVNIVLSEKTDDLLKFQGVDRISGPMIPNIAIPTTAGTGSEVTAAAIIYNEDAGVKMAFMSNKLYPNVAIIDTAMMMTMPSKLTAATGMDALTHACEAYYCLQKNPISDAFAVSAIMLIRDFLALAVENGEDKKARIAMANAATIAGIAFSNSMVGMVHSLAHACGGIAHVPHGIANSILLPFGMDYNVKKATRPLAELADILSKGKAEGSDEERAARAGQYVRDIARKLNNLCGLPLTLQEAGIKESQLEQIAKVAVNDGSLTYNPEECTEAEALEVLKLAYK